MSFSPHNQKTSSRKVRKNPQAEGYIQLGHALKLQNRREEAADAYREALRHDPDATVATVELAALGF
ncbi:tetratricopeptide repeat protein [Gluconobacter sp. R75629]|uniref:tetratricopeptide repeat protein n=1 Tax=unclassified Gluconobacter TaxID=2644261 RepID=UPI00188556D0|nr:tetratricopeptide repeat protein [Gluconobacter sp. R75628]MBF0875052.1 tetratricopeptide repeat protein [Gluconobacter sp. R75629]